MKKTTFYFSHDYNARTDAKIKKLIQVHGILGYGIYWSIIEDLYNNANALPLDYDSIAFELRLDNNIIKSVINDFGLFEIDESIFYSKSVQERLLIKDAKSESARNSALERWEKEKQKTKNDANALQTECEGNAIKEIKLNETKLNKTKDIDNNIYIDTKKSKTENPKIVSNNDLENISKTLNISNLDYDSKKLRLTLFKENFLQLSDTEKKDFCNGHRMLLERLEQALNNFNLHLLNDKNSYPFTYSFYKEWFNTWLKGLSAAEFDIYMTRIRRD